MADDEPLRRCRGIAGADLVALAGFGGRAFGVFQPDDVRSLGAAFLGAVKECSGGGERVEEIIRLLNDEQRSTLEVELELLQLLTSLGAYVEDTREERVVIRATLCCTVGTAADIPKDRCRACAAVAVMPAFTRRLQRQKVHHEAQLAQQERIEAEISACTEALVDTKVYRLAQPHEQSQMVARTTSRVRTGNVRPAEVAVIRGLEDPPPGGGRFASRVPGETLKPEQQLLRFREQRLKARLTSMPPLRSARVRVPSASELFKELVRRTRASDVQEGEVDGKRVHAETNRLVARFIRQLVDAGPGSPLGFLRGFIKAVELGRLRGDEELIQTMKSIGESLLAKGKQGRRYTEGTKRCLLRLSYKGGLGILQELCVLGLDANRRTVQRWRREARLPYHYGGKEEEPGYEAQMDAVAKRFGCVPRQDGEEGRRAAVQAQAVVCLSVDDTAFRRKLEVSYVPAGRGPPGWGAGEDGWCLWGLAGGPIFKRAHEAPDPKSAFEWLTDVLRDENARLATDMRCFMVTATATRSQTRRTSVPLYIQSVSREGDWRELLGKMDMLSASLLDRGLHPSVIAADHSPPYVRAALHRMRVTSRSSSSRARLQIPHHLCRGLAPHQLGATGLYQVFIGDWYHLNQLLAIGLLRPTSVLAFGNAPVTASCLQAFLKQHRGELGDRAINSQDMNESRKQDYPRAMRFAGKDFKKGRDLPGSIVEVMERHVKEAMEEGRRCGWAGVWLYLRAMNDFCGLFERRPMALQDRALLALRVVAFAKIWRAVTDADPQRRVDSNMPSLAVRVSLVLTCIGVLLDLRLNRAVKWGVPELAVRDKSSVTNEHLFGALRVCKDGGMSFTDRTGMERLHLYSGQSAVGVTDASDADLTGGGRRATGREGAPGPGEASGRESGLTDAEWRVLGDQAIEDVLLRIETVERVTQGEGAVGQIRKLWGTIDHDAWDYFGRKPSSSFCTKGRKARSDTKRAVPPDLEEREEEVEGDEGDVWRRPRYPEEEDDPETVERLDAGGVAWKGRKGPSEEQWEDDDSSDSCDGDGEEQPGEEPDVLLGHLQELEEEEEEEAAEEAQGGRGNEENRRFAAAVETVLRAEEAVMKSRQSEGEGAVSVGLAKTVGGVPLNRRAALATIQKAARSLSTGLGPQSNDRLRR